MGKIFFSRMKIIFSKHEINHEKINFLSTVDIFENNRFTGVFSQVPASFMTFSSFVTADEK